jgi:hypothetical protein
MDSAMDEVLVPVSPGELLDKITILRIKAVRMDEETKLAHVRHELTRLEETWRRFAPEPPAIADDERALARVNATLWEIEDRIRGHEAAHLFDAEFIELARAVYVTNDERAAIKRRINLAMNSAIVEEKFHPSYITSPARHTSI